MRRRGEDLRDQGAQTETVTKRIIHVDFYEIRLEQKLTLDVPIDIVGASLGVEKGGELKQSKEM